MSAAEPAQYRGRRPELGTQIRRVRYPGLVSLRNARTFGWTVVTAGRRGDLLPAMYRVPVSAPASAAVSRTPTVTVGVTIVTACAAVRARPSR
jgi:hypothetical protein